MFAVSLVLIIVGVAVIAAAVVYTLRRSSSPAPAPLRADESIAFDDDVIVEPYPSPVTAELVAVPAEPQPTWPDRVQPNAGALDGEARLRLIGDLALLRARWCIPILEEACAQETDPDLQAAAFAALAKCRRPARAAREVVFSTNGAPPEDRSSERSPSS